MFTDILRAAFFCPMPEGNWGAPLLLHGDLGSGKTAAVRAAAREVNLLHYRLAPSERGEGQFGCVPVPGDDGFLHYPAPDWAKQVDANGAIIFLDEIDSVPMALQAPLLGLVQLRTLGSHTFNARTRIIGAANGVGGTWDLREDICNRFCHLEFEGYSAEEWATNLLSGFAADARTGNRTALDLEAHVMAEWPTAIASARGMVGGFITRRPDLLRKHPVKGDKENRFAFPTPRTCEYASVMLAAAEIHNLSEIDTDTLVAGYVGQGWVSEYRQWAHMADLPAPADVLDGKVVFKHDERRPDRTLAVLGGCAALIAPQDAAHRKERGERFWVLCNELCDQVPDYVVGPARAVLKAGLTVSAAKSQQTTALAKLLPLLQATGM